MPGAKARCEGADPASARAYLGAECGGHPRHVVTAAGGCPDTTPRATPLAAAEPQTRVAALAADRYLLRVTLAAETVTRLRRAQALMGHSVPDGNPAVVIDKALSLLVDNSSAADSRACNDHGLDLADIGVCRRLAPHSRSHTSSGMDEGRRAMCVRWRTRPMQ